MTTLTADNNFSNTLTGPTPGLPRTAASVNAAVQQTLDNTLALANGYRKTRFANITAAVSTKTDIDENYVICDASPSTTTKDTTFEFAVSPTANLVWKRLFFERLDQDTVLTFQAGSPYATFLTYTVPANCRGMIMDFSRPDDATWELRGISFEDRGTAELEYTGVVTAHTVTGRPREIYCYADDGSMPSATSTLKLDATYFRGERVSVFVDGMMANSFLQITDESDNVIVTLSGIRDGSRIRCDLRYHDSLAWAVLAVGSDSRATVRYQTLAAATGSVSPAIYTYHRVTSSVTTAITLTIADGTYDGQELHILFDTIAPGGEVEFSFTGPTPSAGFTIGSDEVVFKAFAAIWLNDRWHILNRSSLA